MTENEKLDLLATTLEADRAKLSPEVQLETLDEWDSMGALSIIAMLDRHFNKSLEGTDIASAVLVRDILERMEK